METVRLRLDFQDSSILTKSQKKQGLKRSWILLKPQHQTISDLSSYIRNIFNLQYSCPRGLILSMDGFVLPPFELTCILKDKDIIRVEKKGGMSTELIEMGNGLNSLEELEIEEEAVVNNGIKLLANEEFEKQIGGYESESEEDEREREPLEEEVQVESTPIIDMVSKKRKASDKLHSSKRKKSKLGNGKKSPVSEDYGKNGSLKKGKRSYQKTVLPKEKVIEKNYPDDRQEERDKSSSPEIDQSSNEENDVARFPQLKETGKESGDGSQTSDEAKKKPSRSARRKKAKRRWLREQAKIEKKKLQSENQLGNADQQLPTKENLENSQEHVQPVKNSDVKDNVLYSEKRHGKSNQQLPTKENLKYSNLKYSEKHAQPINNSDDGENVVPIVVRPGHIRFEPLEEEDADQVFQQDRISVESFQWNGITSKKKGQKWGMEKSSFKRNNDKNFSQVSSEIVAVKERAIVTDDMDFDKLIPYSSLPKEGDLIAYRLVELSSSWTPELSSFRVGKISCYDAKSNKILLTPVPEYPIVPEKKVDDAEECEPQLDTSLYEEDGSLEIDYSSLIDVRLVKHGNSNTIRTPSRDTETNHAQDQTVSTTVQQNDSKEAAVVSSPPAQANIPLDAWEEISQALVSKKAELSKESDWIQSESSGRNPWTYRALRHSALGPTMALLRSQNGI